MASLHEDWGYQPVPPPSSHLRSHREGATESGANSAWHGAALHSVPPPATPSACKRSHAHRCLSGHAGYRLRFLVLVALLAAPGCAERDPLEALLASLVEAAEDRDADEVGELLTADFRATDGTDKAAALALARQYFMGYKALDAELSGVELNRRGPSGRAKFRMTMTGVPTSFGGLGDLVPRKAIYDFDVTARDEDGTWRLASASWIEVQE